MPPLFTRQLMVGSSADPRAGSSRLTLGRRNQRHHVIRLDGCGGTAGRAIEVGSNSSSYLLLTQQWCIPNSVSV